jgi:hypothetical protein
MLGVPYPGVVEFFYSPTPSAFPRVSSFLIRYLRRKALNSVSPYR